VGALGLVATHAVCSVVKLQQRPKKLLSSSAWLVRTNNRTKLVITATTMESALVEELDRRPDRAMQHAVDTQPESEPRLLENRRRGCVSKKRTD
jgi:hypothetical protein